MTDVEALDTARSAIVVLLKVSAPPLLVGLAVGVAISLFQALTQIQEMTLTFVPKVIAIFLSLLIFLPFMITALTEFTHMVFDRVVAGG